MQRNDSLTEDLFRPIMLKGRADSISRIINDASNDPDDPGRPSDIDSITPLTFNGKSTKGNKVPFSSSGQIMKGNRLSMWSVSRPLRFLVLISIGLGSQLTPSLLRKSPLVSDRSLCSLASLLTTRRSDL
jgi:hypothetical protein